MPIYEYRCDNCNLRFEKLRDINYASEPNTCPNCNQQSHRVASIFRYKSLEPILVLQDHADGVKEIGRVNAPDTEPPRPPAWDRNLIEV